MPKNVRFKKRAARKRKNKKTATRSASQTAFATNIKRLETWKPSTPTQRFIRQITAGVLGGFVGAGIPFLSAQGLRHIQQTSLERRYTEFANALHQAHGTVLEAARLASKRLPEKEFESFLHQLYGLSPVSLKKKATREWKELADTYAAEHNGNLQGFPYAHPEDLLAHQIRIYLTQNKGFEYVQPYQAQAQARLKPFTRNSQTHFQTELQDFLARQRDETQTKYPPLRSTSKKTLRRLDKIQTHQRWFIPLGAGFGFGVAWQKTKRRKKIPGAFNDQGELVLTPAKPAAIESHILPTRIEKRLSQITNAQTKSQQQKALQALETELNKDLPRELKTLLWENNLTRFYMDEYGRIVFTPPGIKKSAKK